MKHIHNQILPEGTQLGVYEIKKASKIDSFDITYRAWNHHLKERVEIQEYFPHAFAIRTNDGLGVEPKSKSDKENFEYGLKAFLDKAEILTQIEHPNIVKSENILKFNGTAYLIMDYQEGVPLSKLVRSQASFAETELKFILASILNALQKVHEYKIVHGNIQPAAIILSKTGEPLLTDFTVTRLAIAAHTAKLASELASGYAAQELYEHANEPGPATDFYALGATMYYCITHNQPTAAQSRIMALSKGEPDPMVSLSGTPGTTYSAELLQAIDWMLRPEYNNRPHSAAEILSLLKLEPINSQAGLVTSKQEAKDIAISNPLAKNHLWIGVIAGIAGLVIAGLWFGKKPSEIIDNKPGTVTAQPLLQPKPGKIKVTLETKEDQSADLFVSKSSQESDPDKIAGRTEKEIKESEKQPKPAGEDMQLRISADNNQPKNGMIAESASFPASKSVSKPGLKDKITTEPESDRTQQLAVIDKSESQSKKQNLHKKPSDQDLIQGYLAAAKKAMKAVRLTTPVRDNAYKYYQMVLAIEPDNREARAGLQRIVDRYVWFIKKAKSQGKLGLAKRTLKKAESVLPDDPELQSIRAELAAAKE
jgi:serine/threonine protein kinase